MIRKRLLAHTEYKKRSHDASIAIGTILKIEGKIVEDTSWLRKKDDFSYINMTKLEFVLKGVNLALKWGLRNLEVKTNSDTVCGWIETIIKKEKKVRKNQQRK